MTTKTEEIKREVREEIAEIKLNVYLLTAEAIFNDLEREKNLLFEISKDMEYKHIKTAHAEGAIALSNFINKYKEKYLEEKK